MESSGTLIAMITTMLSSSQVHDNVGFFFYLMQKICMKLRTKGRKVTEQETVREKRVYCACEQSLRLYEYFYTPLEDNSLIGTSRIKLVSTWFPGSLHGRWKIKHGGLATDFQSNLATWHQENDRIVCRVHAGRRVLLVKLGAKQSLVETSLLVGVISLFAEGERFKGSHALCNVWVVKVHGVNLFWAGGLFCPPATLEKKQKEFTGWRMLFQTEGKPDARNTRKEGYLENTI